MLLKRKLLVALKAYVVSTTVALAAPPSASVADYGAVGDGVTNDTTAFNRSAERRGGKECRARWAP